ncbi:MAG: hypothetical protein AB1450_05315 [Pseudomonadota bacterium]
MHHSAMNAIDNLQQVYHQNRQAIEQRLRDEIDLFRTERAKLNPRSPHEAERWSAEMYSKLLQRREYLLQLLSTQACPA